MLVTGTNQDVAHSTAGLLSNFELEPDPEPELHEDVELELESEPEQGRWTWQGTGKAARNGGGKVKHLQGGREKKKGQN